MDTSTPTSKHELLCTKEELQFYALNMLHDLAHDYMENIPVKQGEKTCVTEVAVDQSSTNRYCQGNLQNGFKLIAKKEENLETISWAVINDDTLVENMIWSKEVPNHTHSKKKPWNNLVKNIRTHFSKPPPPPPSENEKKNKLIIDIIQLFKPWILDDTAVESDLLTSQNYVLNTIVKNNHEKTTNYDNDMLCNVLDTMKKNGVKVSIDNSLVGTLGTDLVEHINKLHIGSCKYLIDNAKNDGTSVHHDLRNDTFCPISSSMDGKADKNDICEDFPNASKLQDLSPPEKTEKGDMRIELYTTDENYIVLQRIHEGNNMDLTAEFKIGTFHFESTMSIMYVRKAPLPRGRGRSLVHDIKYIIKLNNKKIIEKIINYSVVGEKINDINLTSNNIYKKALKNIENQEGDNRLVIAYGTLIFKSFGDILQEWNGVLNGGGYFGPIVYADNSEVCKYLDSHPLRVILSKDKLSGARILWSLFKGNDEWKENINKNCFGGYVNKHQYGNDYKIYNPNNNILYRNCVKNKTENVAELRRFNAMEAKAAVKRSRDQDQKQDQDNGNEFRRTKSPKTLGATPASTGTGTTGTTETNVATGGASTIQQETYQDPLTYSLLAIGAFAAMMIGLQK